MYLSKNLKFLRKRLGRTQDDVAHAIKTTRPTYSGYENNVAQPGLETLIALSKYFSISIDTLLTVDLTKLSESELSEIERGFDYYIQGTKLRVLATTVDSSNEENIELVNEQAKAGYASGYADPEYIRVLPVFQLPFLSRNKKYRTFQISGDSMLPIPDKAYVTGEYIQNWTYLKKGDACIIVTLNDGVVFKVLGSEIKKDKPVTLHSLNPLYKPFKIPVSEIKEIWKFVNYICQEFPSEFDTEKHLYEKIANLESDIKMIKQKIIKKENGNL
ncbi:MAG: hypothetical protein Kow0068_22170 [Marinilabiliales bacterium]